MTPVPYLDLKPQYKALEGAINARIQTVLNHGAFILGPECAEAEKALASLHRRETLLGDFERHRRFANRIDGARHRAGR